MPVIDQICQAIEKVLGGGGFKPLHEPVFQGNEKAYVTDTLDSTFVSSVGEYVDRFEEMLIDITGVRRAVAVVSGTAALHMAMKLAGVDRNDEVIMPPLTFVATANAAAYLGAVPHFTDVDDRSLGIDPEKLKDHLNTIIHMIDGVPRNRFTRRRVKALIPVHTFGHPADMERILDVCTPWGIVVIEDAAESIGSLCHGKHTGNFGKLAILSFNGNKTVTTGGGGAILTHDSEIADKAKHLTTTAKRPHPYEYFHDSVGYNYRMPNINAALGCAQLEQLEAIVMKKRLLAERYQKAFHSVPGVRFFTEPLYARSNYWLNTLILDEKYGSGRDDIIKKTNRASFMTRPAWTLLHRLPMFEDCPRADLSVSESLEKTIINIPSGPGLI